jgi:hypothetical protein
MPYSEQEAIAALNSVELVERRTTILRGYEKGAPYFFLWGIIWIIGYSGSQFFPHYAGAAWLLLNVIGVIAGLYIQRAGKSAQACSRTAMQYLGISISVAVFVAAAYFILPPLSGRQLDAFPALLVALIYTLVGLWRGIRLSITGILLTTLTVFGYAMFDEYFALWMAFVGGTTLLTTGFWLRHG